MEEHIDNLVSRYPKLFGCRGEIERAYEAIAAAYRRGGKLLVCGNGGSAADSDHIVGELMKNFAVKRGIDPELAGEIVRIAGDVYPTDGGASDPGASDASVTGAGVTVGAAAAGAAAEASVGASLVANLNGALPAIALTQHAALNFACINDNSADATFAQQVLGLGRKGDVFLGITTSGNSKNVIYAAIVARAKGLSTVALTGRDGGRIKQVVDVCVVAPEEETYKIQELHLPIYHALCLALERSFFG